ncbi:MAG: DUF4255 domain-containing protein [Oscillospiraceae bacterium]|nr:DUF4255 domain-containing protein [Oscillospiraceae bacterium]
MADYTAFYEAGSALVELLRDSLTPEPVSDREAVSLCSPHESGNNQLTLHLYEVQEENQNVNAGYYQVDRDTQRRAPARYILRYLATAHSKAPAPLKEADQHRIMGALAQTVRDNPVIPIKYLSGSAAEERAELHIMLERTGIEQLLKLWNNNSKDYKLSMVVSISGVTIDSGRERKAPRVTEVIIGTEETAVREVGEQ